MDKPTSILKREFTTNLVSLINNSGLPLLVIEPIMKNVWNEVRVAEETQYKKDKESYEQSLREANEKGQMEVTPQCPPEFVENIMKNIEKEEEYN